MCPGAPPHAPLTAIGGRPRQLGEAIGDALRFLRVVELHEGIVDLLEADVALLQLLHDIIVTVDIELTGVRRVGLQTHMHQAEVLVPEIVIKDALGNLAEIETGAFLRVDEFERGAGFHHAQDADQAMVERMLVKLLLGPSVLVDVAVIKFVKPTVARGKGLGMIDELLGPQGSNGLNEISTSHFEDVIDKAFEGRRVADLQMSLEDQPIKTRKMPRNQTSKLDDERA